MIALGTGKRSSTISKMRKLVLGIVTAVCVQLLFVGYNMLRTPVELATAPVQMEPRPAPPAPVSVDNPENTAAVTPEPKIVASRRIEPKHTQIRRSVANPPVQTAVLGARSVTPVSKPRFSRFQSDTTRPAEFESVVIRYNRNPADLSDCEPADISKPKKRSYLAKALPVIKKPWGWLKALGSKLN